MKENTTNTAPAVIRLPYAGPEAMNAAPPRRPRAPRDDSNAAPIPMGNGGAEFVAMDAEQQEAIVRACVVNAFKMIEERSGKPFFEMENAHGDDARQETFFLCLERADDPKYFSLPLALYVSKAAATACNRFVYQSSKGAEELTDTENTPNAARAPSPEAAAIVKEFLPRALALVGDAYRENAARLAAFLMAGYNVKESAALLNIGEKTAQRALNALKAAADIVRALDGETDALERLIESDERTLASLDRRARDYAIAAARHDKTAPAAGAVEWTERKPAAVLDMSRLTYTERIIYAAANQATLRGLFAAK